MVTICLFVQCNLYISFMKMYCPPVVLWQKLYIWPMLNIIPKIRKNGEEQGLVIQWNCCTGSELQLFWLPSPIVADITCFQEKHKTFLQSSYRITKHKINLSSWSVIDKGLFIYNYVISSKPCFFLCCTENTLIPVTYFWDYQLKSMKSLWFFSVRFYWNLK